MDTKKSTASTNVEDNVSTTNSMNNDSFFSQTDNINKIINDQDFLLNNGKNNMEMNSVTPFAGSQNPDKSNQLTLLNDTDSQINDLQLMLSNQSNGIANNMNTSMFDDYLLNDINSELKSSDLIKSKKDEKVKSNNVSASQDYKRNIPTKDNNVTDVPVTSLDEENDNFIRKNHSKKQAVTTTATTHHKSRPIFVMKLWLMMNEPSNNEYIQWSNDGKSFKVLNRLLFMKNVLPKYFKHSNFSSFVRQLNMYGWHKVQEVNNKQDSNTSGDEVWQFQNPYFQKGREDLLDHIVRHKSGKQTKEEDELDVNLVVNELNKIKANQVMIADDLKRVRSDNSLLWQEIFTTREHYSKQNETLNTILRFIASVFQNNSNFNHRDIAFDGNTSAALMNALFESANNATGTTNNKGASGSNGMVYSSPSSDFKFTPGTSVSQTNRPRLMLMGSSDDNNIPSPASIYTLPESNASKRHSTSNDNISEIGKQTSAENLQYLPIPGIPSTVESGSPRVKEIVESDKVSSPSEIAPLDQVTPSSNTINDIQHNLSKQDQSLNALSELLNKYLPAYDSNTNSNGTNSNGTNSTETSKSTPLNFNVDDLLHSKMNNSNPLLVDDIPDLPLPNGSEIANIDNSNNKRKAFEINDDEMNEILSKKTRN